MSNAESNDSDHLRLRLKALSRWENEGGALEAAAASGGQATSPQLTNAELVQLHVRVIALENLVIALLAGASDRERALAREMAIYISPRPGFTPHQLTLRASALSIEPASSATPRSDGFCACGLSLPWAGPRWRWMFRARSKLTPELVGCVRP